MSCSSLSNISKMLAPYESRVLLFKSERQQLNARFQLLQLDVQNAVFQIRTNYIFGHIVEHIILDIRNIEAGKIDEEKAEQNIKALRQALLNLLAKLSVNGELLSAEKDSRLYQPNYWLSKSQIQRSFDEYEVELRKIYLPYFDRTGEK